MINVGSRVLLTNPKPEYNISSSNPAVGSKWECQGTVHSISDYGTVIVKWDNNEENSYTRKDLSIVNKTKTGNIISIW